MTSPTSAGAHSEEESAISFVDVPLERKATLLSGRDFWATESLEEAGVESVTMADGPYGLRHQSGSHDHLAMFSSDPATCFPPAVAVGSSWDPAVAAAVGSAIGREAVAQGVDIVLGPGVNIKRSPLCGRNFEYYSEDPLVAGVLGAAYTRALQSEGPGVSVKHFAANNQETNRQTISADVDERTLRELYLPAFERIVKEAAPATVMAAYNKINGEFCSENAWLLTDVLRNEWGFDGVVISDWNAVVDRVASLRAGLDLEMPGGSAGRDSEVVAAVRNGALDESAVDVSASRIAALRRFKVSGGAAVDLEAHHSLARELAAECAVLLRNEGAALPLASDIRLAVIGEFADRARFQGGGSAHVNAHRVDSPLEEIRDIAMARGVAVTYARGFTTDGTSSPESFEEAVAAAAAAEIAVVFAGLDEKAESEGIDRRDIDLPGDQAKLIRAVAATGTRTVVVLSNGGIVSLEGWHDHADAILEAFLLGQGGGRAIAELLFGIKAPSGHLAESIPMRLEDTASWLNFPGEQGHVRYGEGVLVGYRQFVTSRTAVRYPFGHGLSYTRFATQSLEVDVTGGDSAIAAVEVTNTGKRAGKHVVQLYVSTEAGPIRRPLRELRGFRKLSLEPGESTTVRIPLDRRAFAYWDIDRREWTVAPGTYAVEVALDAATVVKAASIELAGDLLAYEVTLDTPMGAWFDHPEVGGPIKTVLGFDEVAVSDEHMAMMSSMTMRQFVAISGLEIPVEKLDELMERTRA
jgi:beta-glucosidase